MEDGPAAFTQSKTLLKIKYYELQQLPKNENSAEANFASTGCMLSANVLSVTFPIALLFIAKVIIMILDLAINDNHDGDDYEESVLRRCKHLFGQTPPLFGVN